MAKHAVIQTGGKQYIVKENDEILIQKIDTPENEKVEFETLAVFDNENSEVELGAPLVSSKTKAQVVAHVKGDKVRVAKFKAKVRYRKVAGFRPQLTKVKILSV
ncbi:50S ribosomal protein L21 [Candidatus Roizmanbacteria bacterium]|nr:50S ribosomal protein L21 [Candidatus Roizmanbacteria bacterium]